MNEIMACTVINHPKASRTSVNLIDVYDLRSMESGPAYQVNTRTGMVAVLVAYAVSMGDPKADNFEYVFDTYRHLLVSGNKTVACEDFVASK